MQKRLAKKILLIGWDGADWKAINPLMDQGKMPALERLVNQGVMGSLATLYPPLSPMLWTSIGTGVRPFKHGILGFTEPNPHGDGIQPVTSTSRRVKAVWNILNQNGLRSNIIGWWPSHPAEPINGVMISNLFQRAVGPVDKDWPLMPGAVHPASLTEKIAAFRIHPAEISAEQILPFIPKAAEIDAVKDPRLGIVAKILAECATTHACATAAMQLEPWDFMAVYYDAIDHFCHGFMRYHPPKQDHIPEKDFELYQNVVESAYRFHDMMLGTLLKLAGEETTVILVSDHGFHPSDLRPASIPHEPAGPAVEHSPYGIFAMAGPGIKQDELVYGASLLDITPTILSSFGLPPGRDMDGKVLLQCFEQPPLLETVPSWEAIEGNDGSFPAQQRMDPVAAAQAVDQLVALGYIEAPGEDQKRAVEQTVNEIRYNMAQSYIDAQRHADALPLLESLWDREPEELRFGNRLAHCYQALNRLDDCRATVERLIETRKNLARQARKELKAAARKKKEADQAGDRDAQRAAGAALARLSSQAAPYTHWADYLKGWLLFAEGRLEEALKHLRRAEKARPRFPDLHVHFGQIYLKMKRWEDAESAFRQALETDPECAPAHLGLCQSLLPRQRNLEAAETALNAVGLLYYYPQAHFCLGIALHRIGYIERALEALQVALIQNPNFIEAHKRLAYIYKNRLKDPEKAKEHEAQIKKIKEIRRLRKEKMLRPEPGRTPEPTRPKAEPPAHLSESKPARVADRDAVIVVSGLPRAGTSMIMQMLSAGGLDVLTDEVRGPDADNPKGYFEFEKVKGIKTDASWLAAAKGKGVKIVAQLIPFLPQDYHYRVIFIERDLDEILASQAAMLLRQDKKGADLSDKQLARIFSQQLDQVKNLLAQSGVPVLYLRHQEVLQHPAFTAERLRAFLDRDLDESAMAAAVDLSLYRQRGEC